MLRAVRYWLSVCSSYCATRPLRAVRYYHRASCYAGCAVLSCAITLRICYGGYELRGTELGYRATHLVRGA
eukprot:1927699-Rhodomonas_salina.1